MTGKSVFEISKLSLLTIAVVIAFSCSERITADLHSYSRTLIHSHNDYVHSRPFEEAYQAGVASIEADVWLVDGVLYVAHDQEDITKERTLLTLYLEPIRTAIQHNQGKAYPDGRPFQLLVDLKNDGQQSLKALTKLIEDQGLSSCFDLTNHPEAARLTITGDAVPADLWNSFPPYVFFDGRPGRVLTEEQQDRVPLVSQNKKTFTRWNGFGRMSEEDKEKIRSAVKAAHDQGTLFRLWGFPDTPRAWDLSVSLGIDYINTDHPAQAAEWLTSRQK